MNGVFWQIVKVTPSDLGCPPMIKMPRRKSAYILAARLDAHDREAENVQACSRGSPWVKDQSAAFKQLEAQSTSTSHFAWLLSRSPSYREHVQR
jgi:hypothetical protein